MDLHDDFHIHLADWRVDREALEPLRLEVFVAEQGVPAEEEFDDDDPVSQHFIARAADGPVVGTARLTPRGRVGRMAVRRDWRGRGVGSALLLAAMEHARLRGDRDLRLAAQVQALGFYERHGFAVEGEPFEECGIPHRWMHLALSPLETGPVARRRREAADPADIGSGRFEGPSDYAERVHHLIQATRQRLDVFTHDLEPAVLNRPEIVEALRSLLAEARDPQVRVVVIDSGRAVELGHRWITLAQQRSSAMALRNPPPELADESSAYMVADGAHVICREFHDRWEGYVRIADPGQARLLGARFATAWEHGHPDPDSLRLSL